MGLGCHLIHVSILKAMAAESEVYNLPGQPPVWRIFDTPAKTWFDPELMGWVSSVGTEDLEWYTRIMKQEIFTKAGWRKFAKKEFPFLCDTGIYCKHIDWEGVQYPARGEDSQYLSRDSKKKMGLK